jgi:hypothetical protein
MAEHLNWLKTAPKIGATQCGYHGWWTVKLATARNILLMTKPQNFSGLETRV